MSEKDPTRLRIVKAAVRLFQERGYAAVGVSEILEAAAAPKGSMYHHFPGGKEALALEAMAWLSAEVESALERGFAAGLAGADLILRLGQGMAGWLGRSDFRQGCLIGAIALEATEAPALRQAAREAFARWRAFLARALVRDGWTEGQAQELAELAIVVAEGALMLARAERDEAPLSRAVARVAGLARRNANG